MSRWRLALMLQKKLDRSTNPRKDRRYSVPIEGLSQKKSQPVLATIKSGIISGLDSENGDDGDRRVRQRQ